MDLAKLKDPFLPTDVEWRIQSAGKNAEGKVWAKVICYIDNRAICERLDAVCGPAGWTNEFKEWQLGTPGVLCGIGIWNAEQRTWVWKWDGAEQPKEKADGGTPVAVKGGFSQAMKRAGAQWGIGRYLYGVHESFAKIVDENTGGRRYAKLKDKSVFYWLPPTLPKWALPEGEPAPLRNTATTAAAPVTATPAARNGATRTFTPAMASLLHQGMMPLGKYEGHELTLINTQDLETARTWCWEHGGSKSWAALIDRLTAVIDKRKAPPPPRAVNGDPRVPPDLADKHLPVPEPIAAAVAGKEPDDGLPF